MYKISPLTTEKITINNTPLVAASEIAAWMNLGPSAAINQAYIIDELTQAAVEAIEKYTWLTLRRTTYQANYLLDYNYFCRFISGDLALSIERAPIISINDITKIEYLENDIWNEFDRGTKSVDGLYDNTTEKIEQRQWASIYFNNGIELQSRYNAYKIRITFDSGFVCDDLIYYLPHMLKLAIKKIVAHHYVNRGDCAEDCDIGGYPVPCGIMGLIDAFAISKTVLGGSYNPL